MFAACSAIHSTRESGRQGLLLAFSWLGCPKANIMLSEGTGLAVCFPDSSARAFGNQVTVVSFVSDCFWHIFSHTLFCRSAKYYVLELLR